MSYRIATFNVKNLSAYTSGRDLDRIAAIINENHLDIVAMQEVLSEGKILDGGKQKTVKGQALAYEKSLKMRLRGNWEVAWKDPKTAAKNYPYLGDDNRGEGYAFLWNADKFELLKNEKGNRIHPVIFRNYRINNKENRIRLIREPCYGRFKVKNLKAEIRLITTHIVYGKPKSDNLSVDLDIGAINMRRNEFSILAGDIYKRIDQDRKDINQNSVCTVLLGDYNLNLASSGLGIATIPDIVFFDSKGRMEPSPVDGGNHIYTMQSELTTLSRNAAGYANNYDHFSYGEHVKQHFVKSVYRIDAVHENIESGDTTEDQMFSTYKTKVSDHVPVVIEIDFK